MTYKEKLQDPRWQKKRLSILKRDNWTCQICHSTEKTLTVHHFKYSKNPWDTTNNFLLTVCKNCHKELQIGQKAITEDLKHFISQNPDPKSLGLIFGILSEIDSMSSNQHTLEQLYTILRSINSVIDSEIENLNPQNIKL
jgi:5-methylcytosine-specific restriction endonuclease McrA